MGTTNYSYIDEIGDSPQIYYRLSLLNQEFNVIEEKTISIENEDYQIKIIEQFDLIGNKITSEKPNQVVLDCYSDGSIEKKVVVPIY